MLWSSDTSDKDIKQRIEWSDLVVRNDVSKLRRNMVEESFISLCALDVYNTLMIVMLGY